jgi:hypothetical protein
MQKIDLNTKSIDFGADWSEYKKWLNGTYASLLYTWCEDELTYSIFAEDGIFTRVVGINKDNGDNHLDFEENFKNFKPLEKRQSGNKALLVANAAREGNETIYASHNFCDPTTWFGDSVRTTEVLSGSGTVFSSSYVNWINMEYGKVLDEEGWKEDVSHAYQVVVVAADVTRSMREPYATSGGDYTVNYESGSITFVSGTYSANQVTASFSYANGSTFYIKPFPYKKLDIEEVEAQFTKDIIMNDTIVFGVFGYVQVFAPQYWEGLGGPLPTNYKIELKTQKYKTISQLVDEALGSYPVVPAIGGSQRGFTNEMYGFPFRYGTVRTLYDSYGLEVRVYNKNHIPHSGERVTATFYCVASDEI